MGFEEKTPNLLAFFTAHARGSSPVVAVLTWPPTPIAMHTSPADPEDKKRKRAQGGKSAKGTEKKRLHSLPTSPKQKKPEP